jgi:hypothetical protein
MYSHTLACSHGVNRTLIRCYFSPPQEGYDHIFFYALEHRTGLHFIHGYPVLLGVFLGAWFQDNDAQGGARCGTTWWR